MGGSAMKMRKSVMSPFPFLVESDKYFGSGSGAFYASYSQYDWQDRQTGTLGPDGVATISWLDNLGEVGVTETFGGSTYSAGQIVEGDMLGSSNALYDAQGRVYESDRFGVGDHCLPTDTATPGEARCYVPLAGRRGKEVCDM